MSNDGIGGNNVDNLSEGVGAVWVDTHTALTGGNESVIASYKDQILFHVCVTL